MRIPCHICYCSTQNYPRQNKSAFVNFKGLSSAVASEKGVRGAEYALRVVGNTISDIFTGRGFKKVIKEISEIKPASNRTYLQQLEDVSRIYSSEKSVEINLQDKILGKLAKNDESAIYVMSHSNQKEDPSMLAVLHMFLVKAYEKCGKQDNFPLPKIILNQDILKTMNKTKRKAFEAFGAVGVDASINSPECGVNAKALIPLMKDFVKNKCNIFIFPEGRMAVFRDLPLEARFQNGTAELVNKLLDIKKKVTVVPVGFSYGKKTEKGVNCIQIGEPLVFTRNNEKTTSTAGRITKSKFADKDFASFFNKHNDEVDVTITQNGTALSPKEVAPFIKSIICENMEIAEKEARENLRTNIGKPDILV